MSETFFTTDGLQLAIERFGPTDGIPLVFAHGFGQTRHAWTATAQRIGRRGYACLTADGRGHGESGWLESGRYDLEQFVVDLDGLARQGAERPVLVGASMGGLIGLLAQAESQDTLFRAMVLVDITPRWETQGVERILTFMGAHPEGFDSVEQAQAAVVAYLPHRRGEKSAERLRKMLVRHHDGRYRWHWDPRLLEQVARDAERYQSRLVAAASSVRVPLLLISGGFSDVVSDATIDEFLQLVPHARHQRVERATHMVVGDENDVFTDHVLTFIESLAAPAAKDQNRSCA